MPANHRCHPLPFPAHALPPPPPVTSTVFWSSPLTGEPLHYSLSSVVAFDSNLSDPIIVFEDTGSGIAISSAAGTNFIQNEDDSPALRTTTEAFLLEAEAFISSDANTVSVNFNFAVDNDLFAMAFEVGADESGVPYLFWTTPANGGVFEHTNVDTWVPLSIRYEHGVSTVKWNGATVASFTDAAIGSPVYLLKRVSANIQGDGTGVVKVRNPVLSALEPVTTVRRELLFAQASSAGGLGASWSASSGSWVGRAAPGGASTRSTSAGTPSLTYNGADSAAISADFVRFLMAFTRDATYVTGEPHGGIRYDYRFDRSGSELVTVRVECLDNAAQDGTLDVTVYEGHSNVFREMVSASWLPDLNQISTVVVQWLNGFWIIQDRSFDMGVVEHEPPGGGAPGPVDFTGATLTAATVSITPGATSDPAWVNHLQVVG